MTTWNDMLWISLIVQNYSFAADSNYLSNMFVNLL